MRTYTQLLLIGIALLCFSSSKLYSLSEDCLKRLSINASFANNVPALGGCTDPLACNYDPLATFDDGSCIYSIPFIEWQNTLGGSGWDELTSLAQTSDGGYIVGGWSDSNISGDKTENSNGFFDYWVVKLDAMGVITWQNSIGGSGFDRLFTLSQTSDGGYILGGYSYSNISGDKTESSNGINDYWVVKLDAMGAITWQNTLGGSGADNLTTLMQTSDGGYILGGYSDSNISGDKTENSNGINDYWVVKLDAMGTVIWQSTLGGSGNDNLASIIQTSDGGYILGGGSESNISGDKTENSNGSYDFWVVKLDALGNIVWQNTIGGSGWDELTSLVQTSDGGYVIGGWSNSSISGDKTENSNGSYDYWVLKLDALGNIVWQNTLGGSGNETLTSLVQSSDGGYILGGWSNSNISGDKTENSIGSGDYWVVKLNDLGNISWQNTIGGGDYDELTALTQTSDGGYFLGGYSISNISGDKTENSNGSYDYWVLKLSPVSSGCTDPQACNYNSTLVCDDGSCEYLSCATGCTDSLACNFDPNATIDDGSCVITGASCNDLIACTFNDVYDANCECHGIPDDAYCDDGNPCTTNTCDPILGCTSTLVVDGTLCDDGDPTTVTQCVSGLCTVISVDMDLDGFDNTVDCNDNDPLIYPGAPEICNGIDDNCDGVIDDGVLTLDTDNDGLFDCEEILIYFTDPNDKDSDGDGLTDGLEVNLSGTNPNLADTDGDGCTDDLEFSYACPDSVFDPCPTDFTGDGIVGTEDLLFFLMTFGELCP